jgi:hypothetical protein
MKKTTKVGHKIAVTGPRFELESHVQGNGRDFLSWPSGKGKVKGKVVPVLN